MKIHKTFKIEKCAAKAGTRYAIEIPWLDVTNSVVVATNGKCVAVVPVELEPGDTGGAVPVSALVAARAGADRVTDIARIGLDGGVRAWTADGPTTSPRPDLGVRLPSYHAVIPGRDDHATANATVSVLVSVRDLAAVAGAIGARVIRLQIQTDEKGIPVGPIRIDPESSESGIDGACGATMPFA